MQSMSVKPAATIALALGCVLSGACAPPASTRPDESVADELRRERELYAGVEKSSVYPLGRLEVFTTSLLTDGRSVKVRGKLRNPMPDTAQGVRLLFKAYNSDAASQRPLATIQEEKEIQIKSGETTALRMDVETMYANTAGGIRFTIEAYAKRVGDRDIPLPPDWKE